MQIWQFFIVLRHPVTKNWNHFITIHNKWAKKCLKHSYIYLIAHWHLQLSTVITLFSAWFLPIALCTHILKTFFKTAILFLSFSHALMVSILPPKYRSQMTNPPIFQIAHMMSHRYCYFMLYAYLKNKLTQPKQVDKQLEMEQQNFSIGVIHKWRQANLDFFWPPFPLCHNKMAILLTSLYLV